MTKRRKAGEAKLFPEPKHPDEVVYQCPGCGFRGRWDAWNWASEDDDEERFRGHVGAVCPNCEWFGFLNESIEVNEA
jgi:hypothetical protein